MEIKAAMAAMLAPVLLLRGAMPVSNATALA